MTAQQGDQEFVKANNRVPSSLAQVRIQTKYEFLNYFRSRRFYILFAIGLVIEAALTIFVWHSGGSSYFSDALDFYSTWWGDSATFVVVFCAIFFGGDAISSEFQNKTGYYLVPNPIRRSSIYIGKWLAAVSASLIIVAVSTAFILVNGIYYFGTSIPSQFGESFIFTLAYLISALGLAFMFSSLFKSASYSILVSVVLLLFGFTVIEELLSIFVHIEPWFLLSYGSQIIGNILMASYPAHTTTRTVPVGRAGHTITFTTFNSTVPEGLAIMLGYFIVTAVLGLVLFERKEFN